MNLFNVLYGVPLFFIFFVKKSIHFWALCVTKRQCSTGSIGEETDFFFKINFLTYRNTAKAVPLQAWSGPEGSRKLKFSDFVTTAQDGGKVVSLKHRPPLPPGNTPGTHFC